MFWIVHLWFVVIVVAGNKTLLKFELPKNELINYGISAIQEMTKNEVCNFNLNLIVKTEKLNQNSMNDLCDELFGTVHGKIKNSITVQQMHFPFPTIHNTYSVLIVDDIETV